MSAIQEILAYLAQHKDEVFTLQELARAVGKDNSNTGKRVRKLAQQGKLNYSAGLGVDSKVSYLPTYLPTDLPTGKKVERSSLHQKMNTALIEARENGLDDPTTEEIKERQRIAKRAAHETVFPPTKPRKTKIPNFNTFMEKLDNSESASSKHLKEKLNVKGKHRSINKERVFRIIRDVIDTLKE